MAPLPADVLLLPLAVFVAGFRQVGSVGHGAFAGSIVRTIGDPVLSKKAEDVTADELRCLSSSTNCTSAAEVWTEQLLRGLRETNGAAIAAPQVGISKRLIVISIPTERVREEAQSPGETVVTPPTAIVNPEWWPSGGEATQPDTPTWESCLSLPGKQVIVKRHAAIRYRALRLDGTVVEGEAKGRLALLLQHEMDHLEGTLMSDRAVEDASVADAQQLRMDGLGAITSRLHWELAKEAGYSIRTAMFPGAREAVRPEL